jgi:hypothetical protein
MGTCNGVLSSCSTFGFAMESRCHLGKTIVYDTVSNLSWGVDLRSHPIASMIETILADPWPPAEELGREVPEAVPQEDCVVSFSFDNRCSPFRSLALFISPLPLLLILRSSVADTHHTGMLQLGVWGFRVTRNEHQEFTAIRLYRVPNGRIQDPVILPLLSLTKRQSANTINALHLEGAPNIPYAPSP